MIVEYIQHMGSDLTVVNAARVSFEKESKAEDWEYLDLGQASGDLVAVLNEKDQKLIKYLAKHNHWTPFGHCQATFRIKAPIFVARQLGKHQVGMVWNEVSRRYVDSPPEFYIPDQWRMKAENVKQGSSDELLTVDGKRVCRYCLSELEFLRKEDEKMKHFCSSKCQSAYYRKHTDKGWAATKIARLKQSAAKRGIEFSLTTEDLMELGRPKYCKYLEVELDYTAEGLQPNSPSVNRIDPAKGYIVGNIEIISNKANSMLLNASYGELMAFVRNVALYNGGIFMDQAPSVGEYYDRMIELYNTLIDEGMCAEQARMFMPQSQYCEWYWTGSLAAWARVCKLRLDSHTQKETRDIAQIISNQMSTIFPVSWSALLA